MARSPTKSRSKTKPPRRLSGVPLGEDPTTIKNEWARPKGGSLRPVVRELPPIVWADPAIYDPKFALQRDGDPPGFDAIRASVWQMLHRCIYSAEHRDEVTYFWRTIARDRDEAVLLLQKRMYGFATKVIVYDVTRLGTERIQP